MLICSHALGILVFVFAGLKGVDWSGFILRRIFLEKPVSMESKQKEERIRTLVALVLGLLLSLFGINSVSNLQVEPVTIPIKGLHPSLNGTTIVQLSDVHLGPYIGRTRLKYIVDVTNSLKADIVVITGDLTDSPLNAMLKGVEPLNDVWSRHGTYFCTGQYVS